MQIDAFKVWASFAVDRDNFFGMQDKKTKTQSCSFSNKMMKYNMYIFHPQKNRSARSCLQAKTQIRARAFLRFTCSSSSSFCAWPAKPSYRNQSWGRDCSSGDKLYHCIDIMSSRVSHLPLATHCCSWENYRVVAPIPSHPYLACPHYTKVASPDNENKVF